MWAGMDDLRARLDAVEAEVAQAGGRAVQQRLEERVASDVRAAPPHRRLPESR